MALATSMLDPVDVPGRVDVRHARAQLVVDHHVATLERDTGRRGVDAVGVAGPSDGEEDRVDVDVSCLAGDGVDGPHAWLERLDSLGACAGGHVDAAVPKGRLQTQPKRRGLARGRIRGAYSISETRHPKSAKMDAGCARNPCRPPR